MTLSKKDAILVKKALADVNKIRAAVALKPLSKFPKAKDGFTCLELAFPDYGRDVGCEYIGFEMLVPGFKGEISVNVVASDVLANFDGLCWGEDGKEAFVG